MAQGAISVGVPVQKLMATHGKLISMTKYYQNENTGNDGKLVFPVSKNTTENDKHIMIMTPLSKNCKVNPKPTETLEWKLPVGVQKCTLRKKKGFYRGLNHVEVLWNARTWPVWIRK